MPRHNKCRAIILTGFVLFLFAQACSKPEEEEPEPVAPVQTAAVQKGSIHRIVRAEAVLYPVNQAAITPKISAPVRHFLVNRGDHVWKGQLLAELENKDLMAAVVEARGNYNQAAANLRNVSAAALPDEMAKSQGDVQSNKEALDAARKVYESRKELFDQGAIPRKQLDEAEVSFVQARSQYEVARKHLESLQKSGREAQIKAAQAQVEAAEGRRQAAEAQLQYSRIYSPINGIVADRPIYAGEMANSGTPLLTVMDVSSIIARASVPIGELGFLKAGDDASIVAADGSVQRARVTVVSPALDPNSTTAEVWVKGTNSGERLHPGATVQVSIIAETINDTLVIPTAAILPNRESTGEIVLVVGPDSVARERKIETGVREDGKVRVLRGLAVGEQVVIVGGYGIQDKTKVKAANPAGD